MRFIADENFDARIIKALRVRFNELDIITVQELGLIETDDPIILEVAGQYSRILLTHDAKTMPMYAYERMRNALPMPGLIVVHDQTPLNRAIEDMSLILGAGQPKDFENQVIFVPWQ
jgi:hypothetical protein